jgi:hypothetical protein
MRECGQLRTGYAQPGRTAAGLVPDAAVSHGKIGA